MNTVFTICSAGDVSFQGRLSDTPSKDVFSNVAPFFEQSDLSIVNLENPLVDVESAQAVPGKCTLRGAEGWADTLKQSGVKLVSLANNHLMDYGPEGLFSTLRALDQAGLPYIGAGKNLDEALRPLFIELNGKKISIIARSSVVVASRCYAGVNEPGVAFFDVSETTTTIRNCKKQSDCVVVILHWGIEQYEYPTPEQRNISRELVRAGADMILGHHPHVLQGVENIEGCLIVYSMGNFLFDEFDWSFINREGLSQKNRFRLSDKNRKSGMVLVHTTDKNQHSYQFIPTRIGTDGTIKQDKDPARMTEFSNLGSMLKMPAYNPLWKLYSLYMEWTLRVRPIIGDLSWSRVKKIRPGHFRQLADALKRSLKITSEKSTNPYE